MNETENCRNFPATFELFQLHFSPFCSHDFGRNGIYLDLNNRGNGLLHFNTSIFFVQLAPSISRKRKYSNSECCYDSYQKDNLEGKIVRLKIFWVHWIEINESEGNDGQSLVSWLQSKKVCTSFIKVLLTR